MTTLHLPPLFAWGVEPHGEPRVSKGGVTDDQAQACWHVFWELTKSPPGTRGVVRQVALDLMHPAEYRETGEVSEAWHDPDTGGIVWTGAPAAPVEWLELKLAEARDVIPRGEGGRGAGPAHSAAALAQLSTAGCEGRSMDAERRRVIGERVVLFNEMLNNLGTDVRKGDPERVEALREMIEERRPKPEQDGEPGS